MPTNIVCSCDEIIMKSEGQISKIRSRIMLLRDNGVFAVCKGCGTEVQVPLSKAAFQAGPPLILRK